MAVTLSMNHRSEMTPEQAFARMADFKLWEAQAKGFGIIAEPRAHQPPYTEGQTWDVSGKMGSRVIETELVLTERIENERLVLETTIWGIGADLVGQIVPVTEGGCEVKFTLTLLAKSIASRLLLGPVSIGREKIEGKATKMIGKLF